MANLLIPNGQLIAFNFPAGAGGKMLQNCVGFSRYCVLSKQEYARWQLDYTNPIEINFYRQKLAWVLKTLPPEELMHNWLQYELGEPLLYGINFRGFSQHLPIPNREILELAERGLWSTMTSHNAGVLEHYIHYWPTIKMVCLVNNEQFARKALAIKNVHLNFDEDWKTLGARHPKISVPTFDFDIDGTIYDRSKFLNQVQELYKFLNFDDFRKDIIGEYYNQYIARH